MTVAQASLSVDKKTLWKRIKDNWYVYMFILPGLIYLIVFSYVPMYGITLAFKEFFIRQGILGSPWIGLANFKNVFNDNEFPYVFFNTIRMGLLYVISYFPCPIMLALLLNELMAIKFKKVLQTIFTFPNFLSWVILSGVFSGFLSAYGLINTLLVTLDIPKFSFMTNEQLIRPIMYITNIWKNAGWSSIIYLAAITSIDPTYYEAARVDGANRFHQMWYITLPMIRSTAVILLVLSMGGIMTMGFDQIFNMTNPVVRRQTEIIDTYIYRRTFQSNAGVDYGFSTAVGLFKSVINFILLMCANQAAKLLGEGGIF